MRRSAFNARRSAFCALMALGLTMARPAAAQDRSAADSAAYGRAQALVSSGEGAAGRALVDSILARTPSGSLRYAEGLYWRAALATNALDAERDYRRVAVEYPLSPRVPAALTRLAQLEMARGDRALARRHLERLLGEYPPPDQRAGAWYWLGRIAFESGDAPRGCAAIDSARASAPAEHVELVNQIASEGRRCASLPAAAAVAYTNAADAPAPPSSAVTKTPIRPKQMYTVQVGAYPSRAAANEVRARLAANGYAARVVPRGKLFGVRVGRYAARADAERTVARLRGAKYAPMVVAAEDSR
ncbi:MAG TPA: SPOR domain-containing protein [Gemmatimonadaceae bacterium]|nr:SPOR domain-containing protein [Gemmatimonadaceae bacterium]